MSGTTYLPQLVVNHHIVWFNITVHDSHTMTVVQSLADRYTYTGKYTHTADIKENSQCIQLCIHNRIHYFKGKRMRHAKQDQQHISPSVVHTYSNGYQSLSTSGTDPAREKQACINISITNLKDG